MTYTDREIYLLRQQVERLERQVAFLMEKLGIEYHDEPNAVVSPKILELVRKGAKIQAIKLFRQETGADLKTAKEFIEALEL